MKKEEYTTQYQNLLPLPPEFLETVKCEVMINNEWVQTEFFMKTKKKPKWNAVTAYEDVRFTCMIK